MSREDALLALDSEVPAERLEAARYLQFWAVPADIPKLRTAMQKESVIWVRAALDSALRRLGDVSGRTVDLDSLLQDEFDQNADAAAVARARIARSVVHELEPIIGAVEYYAALEIRDYDRSRTQVHVERMARLLRALEKLGKVSANPALSVVDVSSLLSHIIEAERVVHQDDIALEGPVAMQARTDPDFLEVIVSNALRNACEAVAVMVDMPSVVTVLYGVNDRELWITVVDNGVGMPPGSSNQLFELGTSTKEDHLGVGLTLAKEAARALGGNIRLYSDGHDTRFELSVPLVAELS